MSDSVSVISRDVFFFQAEDGIRDDLVTGVQTCALPISGRGTPRGARASRRLAHVSRAELDADPRPGGAGRLGYRVLPGALAAAAHHKQVAMAQVVTQRLAAAARAKQQGPGRPERDDRDHGVLRSAAPCGVAVPGHAVAAVPVKAQSGG